MAGNSKQGSKSNGTTNQNNKAGASNTANQSSKAAKAGSSNTAKNNNKAGNSNTPKINSSSTNGIVQGASNKANHKDGNNSSNNNKGTLAIRNNPGTIALPGGSGSLGAQTLALGQAKTRDGGALKFALSSSVSRSSDVLLFMNMVVDNSGSMLAPCGPGKTRLQVVLECLQGIYQSGLIRDDDSWVIHTCNGDVKSRCCCEAKEYDHQRLVQDIQGKPGNQGRTRLWDGILTAYCNMKQHAEKQRNGKEVQRYLLAFTDGGDNGSSTQLDKLAATLAHPGLANFHVVVIAAGLGQSDQQKVEQLRTAAPGHCKIISIKSVTEVDIVSAFREALHFVHQLVMHYSKNGSSTDTTIIYSGNAAGSQDFQRQLGSQLSKCENIKVTAVTTNSRPISAVKKPSPMLLQFLNK